MREEPGFANASITPEFLTQYYLLHFNTWRAELADPGTFQYIGTSTEEDLGEDDEADSDDLRDAGVACGLKGTVYYEEWCTDGTRIIPQVIWPQIYQCLVKPGMGVHPTRRPDRYIRATCRMLAIAG